MVDPTGILHGLYANPAQTNFLHHPSFLRARNGAVRPRCKHDHEGQQLTARGLNIPIIYLGLGRVSGTTPAPLDPIETGSLRA